MRPQVIIRHCPDYDPQRIQRIITEGLDAMNLRPTGRTLVKPNCVTSGDYFPNAFTRPEFLEGMLGALNDRRGDDVSEIAVGERCGITIPTRFAFSEADYYRLGDRVKGLKFYHFDEETQVEIPLYHEGRLRDSFYTPEPIAKADFFVNCPKFKAHPWTTVTFSMKNYIGIQDDRHRLIDHDHKLDQKIGDLQYIIQPQFIAIDAIIAGEGRMLTPLPYELKLIIMGNNQVAFDAVCCHIIGLDPESVEHIRIARQRGFGPTDLEEIDISGDVRLHEAQERGREFKSGLIRVEDYFQGSNIKAYAGPPPGGSGDDYCWGGCPGAMEEAIEVLRLYDQATDEKMPPTHIVFGDYQGPIDASADEKIVFIGDCAKYSGEIAGQQVDIESSYVDRSQKNPLEAKHGDIFAKILGVQNLVGKDQIIRLGGCPVSVAEQVLLLVLLGKLKNPYFDPKQTPPFMSAYLSWRSRQLLGKLFGKKYNQSGPTERGAARPKQNLPPEGADRRLEKV